MESKKCAKCGEVHKRCSGHRKRKNTGGVWKPCGKYPVDGFETCELHGAKALSGTDHPNFKHGLYSARTPASIRDRLIELDKEREEGSFLSLKRQIKLVEVKLSIDEEKLNTPDARANWKALREAETELRKALVSGEPDQVKAAMNSLNAAIRTAETNSKTWDDLFADQKHYERLLASERKKMIEDKFMLTLEDVFIILAMIGHAVNQIVSNQDERNRLGFEVKRIAQKNGLSD